MELIEIKKVEDCFDGSVIFEYSFNEEIREKLMKKMSEKGNLYYYPEFPRPFFKIITSDGLQIKGIIGDTSLQVIYPQSEKWTKKRTFENHLRHYIA